MIISADKFVFILDEVLFCFGVCLSLPRSVYSGAALNSACPSSEQFCERRIPALHASVCHLVTTKANSNPAQRFFSAYAPKRREYFLPDKEWLMLFEVDCQICRFFSRIFHGRVSFCCKTWRRNRGWFSPRGGKQGVTTKDWHVIISILPRTTKLIWVARDEFRESLLELNLGASEKSKYWRIFVWKQKGNLHTSSNPITLLTTLRSYEFLPEGRRTDGGDDEDIRNPRETGKRITGCRRGWQQWAGG